MLTFALCQQMYLFQALPTLQERFAIPEDFARLIDLTFNYVPNLVRRLTVTKFSCIFG
ncbi:MULTISPECIES: hypothetical protein [unclassified Moorena]|uniref:hypothetical protein n=1 Tax=unclassified Moorena TaxID=2683338 RepID=UPI0013CAF15F|nr:MULTISPECIES: hypothetical protein [unclassified Moorena]NEO20446.1 hypothetical protein [Moorena sp. SIO4A5]NEQ59982.1 hypothetical protein [Moorena sp. SIO4A1]